MVLAPYLKERLHRLCEVTDQVEFLYTGEIDLERETLEKQGSTATPALEALRAAETMLRATEPFDIEHVEQALLVAADQRGWKRGPALMPIRYAISGKLKTPPLAPMVVALGRERTLQRLEDALTCSRLEQSRWWHIWCMSGAESEGAARRGVGGRGGRAVACSRLGRRPWTRQVKMRRRRRRPRRAK